MAAIKSQLAPSLPIAMRKRPALTLLPLLTAVAALGALLYRIDVAAIQATIDPPVERVATAAAAVAAEESCAPEQFYYWPQSRCRNCSDVGQIFHNYQEWLGGGGSGEVVAVVRKKPAESLSLLPQTTNQQRRQNNNNRHHQPNKAPTVPTTREGPTRFAQSTGTGTSNIGSGTTTANDAVLSRLISVDPQDQEYIDASQQEEDEADSGVGGEELSAGSADAIRLSQTRQDQRLIVRFIRSQFIGNELLGAIDHCRQYQNTSACQMWSNLCVMTMYSHSDGLHYGAPGAGSSTSSRAQQQQRGGGYSGELSAAVESAPSRRPRPWQSCRQFTETSICDSLRDWYRLDRSVELANIYAPDEPLSKAAASLAPRLNQPIQLLAYKYSFDGKLLAVDQFGLADMERFCVRLASTPSGATHYYGHSADGPGGGHVRLGNNMEFKCRMNALEASLSAIKHFNETVFVDLFIGYPLNGAMFVKPVPILIKNLLYNGIQINRKYAKDSSRWKLVHRFFFHSTISLDQDGGAGGGGNLKRRRPQQQQQQQPKRRRFENSGAGEQEDATAAPTEREEAAGASSEEILIYAKSAVLEFKFKRQEKGALLSSILLVLDYGQLSRDKNRYGGAGSGGGGYDTDNSSSNNNNGSANNNNNQNNQIAAAATLLESNIAIVQSLTDMQGYKKDLDLLITILSILSSIWSLIKCYNIQKCYGLVKLDLESLFRFFLVSCDTLANLFAIVTFLFLGYLFAALKFQSTVQTLAPGEELEGALVVNLKLALLFKLIGLAHTLYIHLNADIFFVDWERPKMLTSAQMIGLISSQPASQAPPKEQITGNSGAAGRFSSVAAMATAAAATANQQQQSSFWRPYTVINRWLQMLTLRRQSLTLQLLLFVSIAEFFHVTNLASADPSLDLGAWPAMGATSSGDQLASSGSRLKPTISVAFRILVLSSLYLTLAAAQILYRKYFYEPMISNRLHEFVDLCSVANVSLFCMLYPRFGYYIHGRNANGSGDCGVAEMNALLEREERDLCSKRGLAPNSDQQTFVLILPKIVNDHYRKLLLRDDLLLSSLATTGSGSTFSNHHHNQFQLGGKQQFAPGQQQQQQSGRSRLATTGNSLLRLALNVSSSSASASSSFGGLNRSMIESLVAKNKMINAFLTNFLEHVYKDIDYKIRERRRFESFLLDVDFDDESAAAAGSTPTLATLGAGPLAVGGGGGVGHQHHHQQQHHKPPAAATFGEDHGDGFAALLWLGLELDLLLVELVSLLILDLWLGGGGGGNDQPAPLAITASLVWLLHQAFRALYVAYARHNLVAKALIDEKFLFR